MIRYGPPMKDRREKTQTERGSRNRFEVQRAIDEHFDQEEAENVRSRLRHMVTDGEWAKRELDRIAERDNAESSQDILSSPEKKRIKQGDGHERSRLRTSGGDPQSDGSG